MLAARSERLANAASKPETYPQPNRSPRHCKGDDFLVDARGRSVALTASGRQSVYEDYARRLRFALDRPWAIYVEQALAARYLFRRDVDYVVQDGRVLLVDEFTGRIFAERMLRDGLHQAVEAKEGLLASTELHSAARISRQRFFPALRTRFAA